MHSTAAALALNSHLAQVKGPTITLPQCLDTLYNRITTVTSITLGLDAMVFTFAFAFADAFASVV